MHLTDKHMFPKARDILLCARKHYQLTTGQNYDFLIVNTGIDQRSSMLRAKNPRRNSAVSQSFSEHKLNGVGSSKSQAHEDVTPEPFAEETHQDDLIQKSHPMIPAEDADVDKLTSNLSSLKFVPPSVQFGRGRRHGGLSRN